MSKEIKVSATQVETASEIHPRISNYIDLAKAAFDWYDQKEAEVVAKRKVATWKGHTKRAGYKPFASNHKTKLLVEEIAEEFHDPKSSEQLNKVANDPIKSKVFVEKIDDILYSVTPRERKVLELRFGLTDGEKRTREQIGNYFAVNKDRIRQIEAKALRRFRHSERSESIKNFLNLN